MTKLECLGAKHGDCLVLHHGAAKILFDGGPPGVYAKFLKPWIAKNKPDDGPLEFDLGMVTHIDDDHIVGLLNLTDDLISQLDDGEAQSVKFGQFWFNSFSGLTGKDFKSASVAAVVASAGEDGAGLEGVKFEDSRTREIIASVAKGHRLSNNLGKLGLGDNGPFNGLIEGMKSVNVAPGLVFHVIGPGRQRLQELRKEWNKKIPVGTIAAFTDTSVPNLSSIVFIAEVDGKSLLMTGDARGDDILSYLEAAGRKTDGSHVFDVLKVAHHGSERNATPEFFKAVPAKTYVISADGSFDNPDAPVIRWIAEARGAAPFEYVFASRMKTAAKQKELDDLLAELKPGRNFTARFRQEGELSISVDL